MEVLKRAWADTIKQAGGLGGIAFLALASLATYVIVQLAAPDSIMTGAWEDLVIGIGSFGVAAFLLFMANLITATGRIEKEKRIICEKRIAVLEIAEAKPNFELECLQTIWGGELFNGDQSTGKRIVGIGLTATNIGNGPSLLKNWQISFTQGGVSTLGEPFVNTAPIPLTFRNSGVIDTMPELTTNHMIAKTASTPIPVGGEAQGFFVGLFPSAFVNPDIEADAILTCQDAYRRRYVLAVRLRVLDTGLVSYMPHLHGV